MPNSTPPTTNQVHSDTTKANLVPFISFHDHIDPIPWKILRFPNPASSADKKPGFSSIFQLPHSSGILTKDPPPSIHEFIRNPNQLAEKTLKDLYSSTSPWSGLVLNEKQHYPPIFDLNSLEYESYLFSRLKQTSADAFIPTDLPSHPNYAQYTGQQFFLKGVDYFNTRNLYHIAAEWFQAAVNKKHVQAEVELANLVTTPRIRFTLMRKCAQSHPSGLFYLGHCYIYGQGTAPNVEKGLDLLEKASAAGDHRAVDWLCSYYLYVEGKLSVALKVAKKYIKPVEMFLESIDNVQPNVTLCIEDKQKSYNWKYLETYLQKLDDFKKATIDSKEFLSYLISFASLGVTKAQTLLGRAYSIRKGDTDSNLLKSLELYQDPYTAVFWFKKAAEQEDPVALFRLGLCYRDGLGCPKFPIYSILLFNAASCYNNPQSTYNLGQMLFHGDGIGPDLQAAKIHLSKAQDIGEDRAGHLLARVERELNTLSV